MKSENKTFKRYKNMLKFCQKQLEEHTGEILILGNQTFVNDIQELQKESFTEQSIPIDEDIVDSEIVYDCAIVNEDYLELIKNYNITNVYIISCSEILNPEIKHLNNKSTDTTNKSNVKVEYESEETLSYDEQREDIEKYLNTMVNEILESDGCSGCIKEIVNNIFNTGWNIGSINTKMSEIDKLNEEIIDMTNFLNGEDENGEDYLN